MPGYWWHAATSEQTASRARSLGSDPLRITLCLLEGRRSRASPNGGKGACMSQFTDSHLWKITLKLTEQKKKQVFTSHLPGVRPTNATKSMRTKFPG